MKFTILTLAVLGIFSCNSSKNILPTDSDDAMTDHADQLTYLALGDSYTIGEGVSDAGRYPSQLIAKLNSETHKSWATPKIIARTGWTVDELNNGIKAEKIEGKTFDLVSLSIGVNNQYRGLPKAKFEEEFEIMLLKAITFAGMNTKHVVVLSIPDWGVTPFATKSGRDKSKIEEEINDYNRIKAEICEKYGVTYIDITDQYRSIGNQEDMLASDGLHPSAKMYALWTEKVFEQVKTINF